MRSIYKYQLNEGNIDAPVGAKPLTVQTQNGIPCLWMEVDPQAPITERVILLNATGQPFIGCEGAQYVGTYQQGVYVWHVYLGPEQEVSQ